MSVRNDVHADTMSDLWNEFSAGVGSIPGAGILADPFRIDEPVFIGTEMFPRIAKGFAHSREFRF